MHVEHTFSQLYRGSRSYYVDENGQKWHGLQQIHMDWSSQLGSEPTTLEVVCDSNLDIFLRNEYVCMYVCKRRRILIKYFNYVCMYVCMY